MGVLLAKVKEPNNLFTRSFNPNRIRFNECKKAVKSGLDARPTAVKYWLRAKRKFFKQVNRRDAKDYTSKTKQAIQLDLAGNVPIIKRRKPKPCQQVKAKKR